VASSTVTRRLGNIGFEKDRVEVGLETGEAKRGKGNIRENWGEGILNICLVGQAIPNLQVLATWTTGRLVPGGSRSWLKTRRATSTKMAIISYLPPAYTPLCTRKNTSSSSKQIFGITSSELHQISSKSSQ